MPPDLEAASTATHKRASSAILDLTTLRLQVLYRQKFNGATPGPAHRRACIEQVHAWERRLCTRLARTEAWTMGADLIMHLPPTLVSRHREPVRQDRNVFLDCAVGFFLQHGILSQLRYLRGDVARALDASFRCWEKSVFIA